MRRVLTCSIVLLGLLTLAAPVAAADGGGAEAPVCVRVLGTFVVCPL